MKRTLQELTFKDNFLFAATMMDPENCRLVLERALDMEIDSVEVSFEKSLVYHPEYKGVRLDVYAKDENLTHYNVEMQVATQSIFRRARYYHDQMDMELIGAGVNYEELPEAYVIFICDFDPVGLEKYRYTRVARFEETGDYRYEDGIHTVFLSTKGKNDNEVPKELVKFLQFVTSNLSESTKDFEDDLVRRLQKTIAEIKASREMGARYMLFEEIKREEFRAGKIEGKIESKQDDVLELLEDYVVPESVESKVRSIKDMEILKELVRIAAKAESMDSFETELKNLLGE